MPLVTLREVLDDARQNNYAVPSFNAVDVNLARGLILAAEAERSPIILNLGQGQFRFTPLEIMAPVMKQLAAEATVPVVTHLDHGKSVDVCIRALRQGFSSVMYDGSALPIEENIANTIEVVRIAKYFGASVEAEIGKVGNTETGDEEQDNTEITDDLLTTPEQAVRFMEAVEVDALAVAFGTAHGLYKGDPKLDFERLRSIREKVSVPLVMHGGSGLEDSAFHEAIRHGVAKINYFTQMSHDVAKQCQKAFHEAEDEYYHDAILTAVSATQEHSSRVMRVFGSSGRA
ncbi:class II fructose-bisphosphate aldolase [Pseudovibrio sp. Tun.PSC04-5.I4]|uniref:class II fructose-bisphosphate aldolase n=1 Tax=Pseudovibrio sp. Tun.PSC04-5.I4 TaxID=1798213 RepID=UPI0008814FCB|nr:class II fructose-bisphosphate aldolase [Pseudovibrio sp. Tun.PSC04-5.I4]SDR48864.1 fructose-bisphosphate aldolase [Pseudovibrio sp. Tun.PSC04-5.I4]